MEKEAKQSDKESQPAESLLFATSKHSRPSSSSEDGSEMATTTTMPGIGIEDSVLHCVAFNLRNVFLHSAKGSGKLQPHRHTDHADP